MDDQLQNLNSFNLKEYLLNNWKSTLTILILLAGLGIGIYLVQKQQIFKPRASSDLVNNAFEVSDNDGNSLDYSGNNTFNTKSTQVKLKIKDITPLTQP